MKQIRKTSVLALSIISLSIFSSCGKKEEGSFANPLVSTSPLQERDIGYLEFQRLAEAYSQSMSFVNFGIDYIRHKEGMVTVSIEDRSVLCHRGETATYDTRPAVSLSKYKVKRDSRIEYYEGRDGDAECREFHGQPTTYTQEYKVRYFYKDNDEYSDMLLFAKYATVLKDLGAGRFLIEESYSDGVESILFNLNRPAKFIVEERSFESLDDPALSKYETTSSL